MLRLSDSTLMSIELPEATVDSIQNGLVLDMKLKLDSLGKARSIIELSLQLPVYGDLKNFVFTINGRALSGGFYDSNLSDTKSAGKRQVFFRSRGPFENSENAIYIRIRYTQYWRDSTDKLIIEKI